MTIFSEASNSNDSTKNFSTTTDDCPSSSGGVMSGKHLKRRDDPNNNNNNTIDNKTNSKQFEQREKPTIIIRSKQSSFSVDQILSFNVVCLVIVHILVIAIYAIPVFIPSDYNYRGNAVLDELHIISSNNLDINGRQHDTIQDILYNIFINDYWGRPMNSPSSHKSWRPLSVLLFRYITGFSSNLFGTATLTNKFWLSDINIHRLVSILTHATVAELVSQLAIKILPIPNSNNNSNNNNNNKKQRILIIRCITKILFALHPTHVEVTANAANRPHLLALMCSLLLSDPDINWIMFVIALLFGYLFCETFLFQIIPAAIMIISIQYIRLFYHNYHTSTADGNNNHNNNNNTQRLNKQQKPKESSFLKQIFIWTIWNHTRILIRLSMLVMSGIIYYCTRYYYHTLSIPSGLIRPAENPFYTLEGIDRIRNYMYVLSIHIGKQWYIDFIGFSHEYGYECIQQIINWYDIRLLIPITQFIIHGMVGIILLWRQRNNNHTVISMGLILFIIHLSWTITLFPVAGIIKVGTFIADRLTVASTVSVSIIIANVISHWILVDTWRNNDYTSFRLIPKVLVLIVISYILSKKVHQRSCEWMDSLPLLESSLRTCPRFAKAHLEISKIYSGLYPDKFDLKKSRWHLEQVESIDPTFCDVHQQFAHIAVQQHKYDEFEERLLNALLCPFTLSNSLDLWKRYWNIALDPKQNRNRPEAVAAAQQRYSKYQERINRAVADDESTRSSLSDDKSPLVNWKSKN